FELKNEPRTIPSARRLKSRRTEQKCLKKWVLAKLQYKLKASFEGMLLASNTHSVGGQRELNPR
ncbi:hypothetical protein COX22_04885, partial [Candidatus Falkowbacteria bacterium CG23_combo_of_CG06-09_8_20_14_all_49_15]